MEAADAMTRAAGAGGVSRKGWVDKEYGTKGGGIPAAFYML